MYAQIEVDSVVSASTVSCTFTTISLGTSLFGLFNFPSTTAEIQIAGYVNSFLSKSYSYNVAYIMTYPSSSCVSASTKTTTLIVQGIFTSGEFESLVSLATNTDYSVSESNNYHALTGLTSSTLLSTSVVTLPSSCLPSTITGTISYTAISSPQTYTISDSPLTLSFTEFTFSVACSDIAWTYTAKYGVSSLPEFVSFYQNSASTGGGYFVVSTTNKNDVGSYEFTVKGTMNNG